jgi:hypothetical protein
MYDSTCRISKKGLCRFYGFESAGIDKINTLNVIRTRHNDSFKQNQNPVVRARLNDLSPQGRNTI